MISQKFFKRIFLSSEPQTDIFSIENNKITITNSCIAHFTINHINVLHISPLVIGQITSLLSFSVPNREYTAPSCRGAPKTFSFTISTSTLAGTHLHPWVKRSNYSKVFCLRTQVTRPGFELTLQ